MSFPFNRVHASSRLLELFPEDHFFLDLDLLPSRLYIVVAVLSSVGSDDGMADSWLYMGIGSTGNQSSDAESRRSS